VFALPAYRAQEIYLVLSEYLDERPATQRNLGDALYRAVVGDWKQ